MRTQGSRTDSRTDPTSSVDPASIGFIKTSQGEMFLAQSRLEAHFSNLEATAVAFKS